MVKLIINNKRPRYHFMR